MAQHYIAVDDDLVSARARYVSHSVASYLAAMLDLPRPAIVFLEPAFSSEGRGDVHIEENELDVNVPAGIVRRAPNTIWLAPAREEQIVRSVAHEIGHIAELLGYVAERSDVEEFPRLLANAVSTTYGAGVGWVDRLLNSHFYFHALADGPPSTASGRTWNRAEYWHRLERTRGGFGYLGAGAPARSAARATSSGQTAPEPRPDLQEEPESRRPLLFPVPHRLDDGGST